MITIKRSTASVIALLLARMTAVVPAHAQEPADIQMLEIEQEYVEVFNQFGIDNDTQQELLEKVRNGEQIDADNPDVDPVSSEEIKDDRKTTIRNLYPDGSVDTIELGAQPNQSRAAYEIQNCKSYAHGEWTRHDGCRVVYNGISFSCSFYADYSTRRAGNVKAVIRNVYRPTVHRAIGHSASTPNLRIEQKWQTNSRPATAVMTTEVTALRMLNTTTMTLKLRVAGTRAVATR